MRLRRVPRFVAIPCILAAAACAREEMPPGTGPDFQPPQVTEMVPAPRSAVPDLRDHAHVRFDEPLGDPRFVERMLETSPAWLYEVTAGRRDVRIRPRDGWQPGVVYTFTIPPGLRDLVRNQTREPIVFLFTTGVRFEDTRTGGNVWDREAVRPARDISILVMGADSVPYATVTDTAGAFALEGLPAGGYWAYAYRDQNRNRVLDRAFEPHDSARVDLRDSTAVAEVQLWITPPDTTPPVLLTVEATDSATVSLEFDDLLEPDAPFDSTFVRIIGRGGDEPWPVRDIVVGTPAPEDTTTAAADSSEVPPGLEVREEEGGPPGLVEGDSTEAEAVRVPERARPERRVTVRLLRALEAGEYSVAAGGFVNLRGLTGGGDTTFVYEPPPPAPEEMEEAPALPEDAEGAAESPGPPDESGELTEEGGEGSGA